jgi:hypothetical protein
MLRNFSDLMNTTLLITVILAAISAGMAMLFLFLTAQHTWRHFRARRFDSLSIRVHAQWRRIVRGEIPPEQWRHDSLQCDILQSIVIQEIGAVTDKDRAGLQEFLRTSGLLNRCIERVQRGRGWSRRRAMLALGATRVPEAIDPLSEGLTDWQLDTRMTAVQALGRTGLAAAAEAMIESHISGRLRVPHDPLANALVRCCADQPETLLPHLRHSSGESRELLARVTSEMATPAMAGEMLHLTEDAEPEIRACAARGLAVAPLPLAIPALAILVRDEIWFVRLRAVSALNQIAHPRVIPILLEAVRDPRRLVRTKAAAALAKFEHESVEILQSVVDSRDRFALHAMVSALELSGGFDKVMARLVDPKVRDEAIENLLATLREGSAGLWTTRPADPLVETVFP